MNHTLSSARSSSQPLDDIDFRLIKATQAGLPLCSRPYHVLAAAINLEVAEVQHRLQHLLDIGIIRRMGAVPNHYAIGYTANGMTVWDVDDEDIDTLGYAVGKLDFVTHCYQRPRRLPAWPYNLFAMVHGRSRIEVTAKVMQIEALLGPALRCHDVLYSTEILKKAGLRLTD